MSVVKYVHFNSQRHETFFFAFRIFVFRVFSVAFYDVSIDFHVFKYFTLVVKSHKVKTTIRQFLQLFKCKTLNEQFLAYVSSAP